MSIYDIFFNNLSVNNALDNAFKIYIHFNEMKLISLFMIHIFFLEADSLWIFKNIFPLPFLIFILIHNSFMRMNVLAFKKVFCVHHYDSFCGL